MISIFQFPVKSIVFQVPAVYIRVPGISSREMRAVELLGCVRQPFAIDSWELFAKSIKGDK